MVEVARFLELVEQALYEVVLAAALYELEHKLVRLNGLGSLRELFAYDSPLFLACGVEETRPFEKIEGRLAEQVDGKGKQCGPLSGLPGHKPLRQMPHGAADGCENPRGILARKLGAGRFHLVEVFEYALGHAPYRRLCLYGVEDGVGGVEGQIPAVGHTLQPEEIGP